LTDIPTKAGAAVVAPASERRAHFRIMLVAASHSRLRSTTVFSPVKLRSIAVQ
jgi:hypothetical protein